MASYLNQFYRPGWQTRRNNTFGYVKADWSLRRRDLAEPGRLFPPQPGPRRLAAPLHRRRHRRPRRAGIGTDGRGTRPGRLAARADPFREPGRRRRRTDARLHVVLHLQLLRLGRAGGRPGVPPRRHRGAVLPPQPLRQGPGRRDARRGVVLHHRGGGQQFARRHLVREHAAGPGPRLAPDSGSDAQLQLERAALLAAVRLAVPATRSSSGTWRRRSSPGRSP